MGSRLALYNCNVCEKTKFNLKNYKGMNIIKSKAQWLPPRKKFFTQIFISIRELFTLPFFKETPDGIKKFFTNNYQGKKDEFIFDGSSEKPYYNQITKNISIDKFENQTIIDLGCGNGSFYFWLKNNNIHVKKYYGVDFAYKNSVLSDNAVINNMSVCDYLENPVSENAVYVLSNSLCYTSETILQSILSKLKPNDKIIIIEPNPNLFWDSHFNGIKPHYRKSKQVSKSLENNGFTIKSCSIDYVLNVKNCYLNPISYCLYAIKIEN
jgi:SAM-dependent methyltransferase